jgi:ApaG protein
MTQDTLKTNKNIKEITPNFVEDLLSMPYSENTAGIKISVRTDFIDKQINVLGNLFIWSYQIKIENLSTSSVKLISRYWRIIDEKGNIQEVSGEGVIGQQPTIVPSNIFHYESGVHLRFPSGIMSGHYQMQKPDGEIFNVKIPTFSLDVDNYDRVIN